MDNLDFLPDNFFNILSSKNKKIYLGSLFVIRDLFKESLFLERKIVVKNLTSYLSKNFDSFDISDEEDEKQIIKDSSSLAHYIIRKFIDTGWLEIEYNYDSGFKENVVLPPYTIKLINALYDIYEDDDKSYDYFIFSIYSNLVQANEERNDYRYAALYNAYQKISELEISLKNLYHNVRRKFNHLGFLSSANKILEQHFEQFQNKIIDKVYFPLKTKDSLSRFKGNINFILQKWLRDRQILEELAKQSFAFNNFNNFDQAKEDILSKFFYVSDKLNELEFTIDEIDKKISDYVSASTEKMRFLLVNDTSIKSKMSRIINHLKEEKNEEEMFELLNEKLYLNHQSILEEGSLFIRNYQQFFFENIPQEIDFSSSDDYIEMQTQDVFLNQKNPFAKDEINEYISQQLSDKKEITNENFSIKSDLDLMLTIHSFIRGYDRNMVYNIGLTNQYVHNYDYIIPKINYSSRRKK